MKKTRSFRGFRALGAVAIAVFVAASLTGMSARQGDAVRIDNDDIGGTVSGPRGPEAGVWVIAETRELPTGFRRIVVTGPRAVSQRGGQGNDEQDREVRAPAGPAREVIDEIRPYSAPARTETGFGLMSRSPARGGFQS